MDASDLSVAPAMLELLGQTCITAGVELLSTDQDFATIARHTPLRLGAV